MKNPFSRPRDVIALGLTLVVLAVAFGCDVRNKGGSIHQQSGTTLTTHKADTSTPVYPPGNTYSTTIYEEWPDDGEPYPTTQPAHGHAHHPQPIIIGAPASSAPAIATTHVEDTTTTTQRSTAAAQPENPNAPVVIKPDGTVSVSGSFSDASIKASIGQLDPVIALGIGLIVVALAMVILKYFGAAIPVIGPVVAPVMSGFPIIVPIIFAAAGVALICLPFFIEQHPILLLSVALVIAVGMWLWHAMAAGTGHKALSDLAASPAVPNDAMHPNPIVQAALDKAPLNPTPSGVAIA